MKCPRNLGQLLTIALAVSPLASAVPWPEWLPEVDALVVRQDDTKTTAAPAATATATQAKTTNMNTGSAPITSNLNTGAQKTATGSATDSAEGSKTSSSEESSRTMFNPVDAAGGVSMISPAASLGTQLYKIGEKVSFTWNYTSLQGTPSAVNVLASCSTASATWTISANMSWAPTQTITWDTGAYQSTAVASPLLTEEYTLIIYDVDSSVTGIADAGYLATFNSYTFGLYEGKAYKDLGEWNCATCSGAASLESRALGMAVGMCVVTIFSFTWFVTGFGALL